MVCWIAELCGCLLTHVRLILGLGLRIPALEATIHIPSMSIRNTDWRKYIAISRSRYNLALVYFKTINKNNVETGHCRTSHSSKFLVDRDCFRTG